MQLETSGHVPWWLRLLAATSDDSDSDWDGSETPGSPVGAGSPEHDHGEARPEGLSESDSEGEATSEDIVETDDETESEWSVHTSDEEFIVED